MKYAIFLLVAIWLLAGCRADQLQIDPSGNRMALVLTDEQDSYRLGRYLEILEDPTGDLTIEDVTSPQFDSRFVPSQVDVPNLGLTDSAYWVRLRLRNRTRSTDHWLLEAGQANMQFVDLYVPNPDASDVIVRRTGALRPPADRDIRTTRMVLNMDVPADSERTSYVRFQSGTAMILSLVLWKADAFWSQSQLEKVLHGLFFGALLALLAYNLFLLVSLRERSYLYLVLLLASMTVFEAGYAGYTETYILPSLYNLKAYYQAISFSLLFASMLLFTDSFLELRARHPRFHWVMLVITGMWGVLVLLTPFLSYRTSTMLMVPWALVSLAAVLAAGIASWLRGFPYARFFMFAWSGLLFAFILTILTRLGIIPSTLLSEGAYRLGLLWMAVCWSIALADRINRLQADVQRSEHRLSQILEGLPLGVVVYGNDYRPNYANRRVAEILSNPDQGIQPDLSAGRTLAQAMEYFSFHVAGSDDQYPIEDMPVYRALQGEPDSADDLEADLVDRRVPLEIWASPVVDDKGDVESAIVAFQDISPRKRVEAELNEYRVHLEDVVEERTTQLTREAVERERLAAMQSKLIAWLSSVNEVHRSLGGTEDLQQAHEKLLVPIGELLSAKSVFIGEWDGQDGQIDGLCLLRSAASPDNVQPASVRIEQAARLRGQVEQGQRVILQADRTSELLTQWEQYIQDEDIRTVVLAPIGTPRILTGLFCLGLEQPTDALTEEDITLIERIEFDLANLDEYARVNESYRELTAAEERNRLARDLHDSVTQVLFSASIVGDVLPRIWRRNPELALESLEDLRLLTRGALAEMRTMLLELRPASVLKTPLPELLSQLTEAATTRTELSFQMFVEQIPPLPDEVHIGFYRIAQEALNNVVKHAQASFVGVRLGLVTLVSQSPSEPEQEVKLVIFDDGVGFSADSDQSEHMGLGIMRERAAAIGANLTIESQLENGTQVTVVWPMESNKNHD